MLIQCVASKLVCSVEEEVVTQVKLQKYYQRIVLKESKVKERTILFTLCVLFHLIISGDALMCKQHFNAVASCNNFSISIYSVLESLYSSICFLCKVISSSKNSTALE